MEKIEYLDCDDSPSPENIRRIIAYLEKQSVVPGAALDALQALVKVAYPGEENIRNCRYCGDSIAIPKTPGKKAKDLCKKADCQRQANLDRVNRFRQRERAKRG